MKNCKPVKGRNGASLLLSCALFILTMTLVGCDSVDRQESQEKKGAAEKITIALPYTPPASPLFVAYENGYFKDEGLEVTIARQPSGKASLQAVINGEADFAAVGEVPVMFAVLHGKKIFTTASYMSSTKNYVIVARKDRGINQPADFSGKKIGVTLGTNSEFFMDVFFMHEDIQRADVEVVHIKPPEMYDALMSGMVDAVSTWNPHVIRLQKALAAKQVTFHGEGCYTGRFNITAQQDFITTKPAIAKKLLRAMLKALDTMDQKPEESLQAVLKYVQIDKELLKDIWGIYDFDLALSQSLLVCLEDEARWAIKKKLTTQTDVPNYLDSIYLPALEEVKPEAVTIIR